MANNKILTEELYDYYDDFKYQTVTEEVAGKKKYFIRGPFSKGGVVNKNKRLYPVSVLKEQVEQCQEAIRSNRMVGELEHPCLIDKNFDVLCETGWKSFEKSVAYIKQRYPEQFIIADAKRGDIGKQISHRTRKASRQL